MKLQWKKDVRTKTDNKSESEERQGYKACHVEACSTFKSSKGIFRTTIKSIDLEITIPSYLKCCPNQFLDACLFWSLSYKLFFRFREKTLKTLSGETNPMQCNNSCRHSSNNKSKMARPWLLPFLLITFSHSYAIQIRNKQTHKLQRSFY